MARNSKSSMISKPKRKTATSARGAAARKSSAASKKAGSRMRKSA